MRDLPVSVTDAFLSLIHEERALAWLLVDGSDTLVGAGGRVAHYGLADLERGRPATSQIVCLEGLLPIPESPFLLPSVEMPSGRVADLHLHADGDGTWIILLDVTTERDASQRVQQKAYDMTLLSEREAKLIRQLREAHRALEESREALLRTHRRLEGELREAERYVRSLLPPPMTEPFVTDWRFVPSTELGGDAFGHHWVDPDHFAFYLLDVCGHGVGAALFSVAVTNTLRAKALPGTDFRAPGGVLTALNRAYQMEDHDNLFFTIWYGVFERSTRTRRWASAGHPPAVLVADGGARVDELRGEGPSIGLAPDVAYPAAECAVPPMSRIFVFSDGAFEIRRPDGTMLAPEEFAAHLARPAANGYSELDRVLELARELHGPGPLEDDFSILKLAL